MSMILSECDIAHYEKLFPDVIEKVRKALDAVGIERTVPTVYYGVDYESGLITGEEFMEWTKVSPEEFKNFGEALEA